MSFGDEGVSLPSDPDELYALAKLEFDLDRPEIDDFMSGTPAQQAIAARNYRASAWGQQPGKWALLISIVTLLGTVAGVVSGVAGAGTAVIALKNAL